MCRRKKKQKHFFVPRPHNQKRKRLPRPRWLHQPALGAWSHQTMAPPTHTPTTLQFRGATLPTRVTRPTSSPLPVACVLTHGASGDADSGGLPVIAAALAAVGLPTVRVACASSSLATRAAALAAAAAHARATLGATGIVYGGHSFGARAAVVAAEEESEPPAVAVLLSSFPLHPPGRPAAAAAADRSGLLTKLTVPAIMLRGGRDPFSTQDAWEGASAAARAAGARLTVIDVPGGGHSLWSREGEAAVTAAIEAAAAAVAEVARAWVAGGEGERRGSVSKKRKRA